MLGDSQHLLYRWISAILYVLSLHPSAANALLDDLQAMYEPDEFSVSTATIWLHTGLFAVTATAWLPNGGCPGLPTGVEWQTVAGFQKLSENNG